MLNKLLTTSPIEIAEAFRKGVLEGQRSDSLISYTKDCRVEPITLIDEKVMYLPFLGDILQSMNSIFAGYYLQAVSLDATIGNIQVLRRLDKFNPTRDPLLHSFEDFKEGLPKYSTEALSDAQKDDIEFRQSQQDRANRRLGRMGHLDTRSIKDANNLAVGKLIEVEIIHNERTLNLPIAIRLNTKTIDTQSLLHILGNSKDNKSMVERYHGWKSGELQFWRDIVLCEDLIKAHRTTLAKDKSGVYADMMARRNNNMLARVISKDASVGTASSITIMSDATRKELEYQIGGKLSDFKTRSRVFNDTYMMLMAVVDAEYEHVTIYHRGLNLSTDMSVKEMKIANKNDNSTITDVLKAFVSGHAPSF